MMFSYLQKKFSRKLTFSLVAIIIVAMFLTGFFLTRALKANVVNDLTVHLTTQAQIMATQLPRGLDEYDYPSEKLQNNARDFGAACQCRVTIINLEGMVVADSSLNFDQLRTTENHRQRPEINSALQGQPSSNMRHSRTVKQDLMYSAVPIIKDSMTTGVVRLALPMAQVYQNIDQIKKTIFGVTLLMALLTIVLVHFFSRSISEPVSEMSRVASRIADGDYDAKIHYLPGDEHGQLGRALNQLSSRVKTTVQDLSREKTQLASILNNMVEAVVAVDLSGTVVAGNRALASFFDTDLQKILGQPFLECLRHNQLDELISGVLKDNQPRVKEIQIHSPMERILEAHAVPLMQEEVCMGTLLVMHDISSIRNLEKIRKDFVANVSHELRTPLASIKGYTETLLSGALADQKNRKKFIEIIDHHADRMTRLVNDLLELSVLEKNQTPLNKERVDLGLVCEEVIEEIQPLAHKKNVAIRIEEVQKLPLIWADKNKLKQVFINLIDNAIKASTNAGQVRVAGEIKGDHVHVAVHDSGMGIPEEELPRIFERFYRVDKARSRDEGGTGLGLSIVKHIVEAHHGSISVESHLGKGSKFSFHIPIN